MKRILLLLVLALGARVAEGQESDDKSDKSDKKSDKKSDPTGETDDTNASNRSYGSGSGFTIGKAKNGELRISIYALSRYLNQLPANQTFFDHLGRERTVDTRNDFQFHRAMIFLDGWAYDPKFVYNATIWTVNATNDVAVIGALGYRFAKAFNVYVGWNGLPGTRSLNGSHPLWLSNDRVMADEYFRPFFTSGIWATGSPIWGLNYTVMLGNNLSQLRISSVQLTRDLSESGTIWVMPTTGEFGPRGAFGDFEWHDKLATRFGVSGVHSREDRFGELGSTSPDNTAIRVSDSLNLFDLGTLADGVTVAKADYGLVSVDAGFKWHGMFLGAEYYNRWLWDFLADGALPQSRLHASGFYVQASAMVVPKRLELYGATSQIWGEFNRSWEVLGGTNWYFAGTRYLRLNGQVIYADRSPVSSSFGFYVGGTKGPIIAIAASVLF